MTDATALTGLSQYGAIGIILAVFLTLFVWAARLVLKRLLSHFTTVEGIMRDTGKAISALLEEMRRGREEAVRTLRDEIRGLTRAHAVKRRRKR
jgi:hypothetical protein